MPRYELALILKAMQRRRCPVDCVELHFSKCGLGLPRDPSRGSLQKQERVRQRVPSHKSRQQHEVLLVVKPETAAALKRMIEALLDRGAIVRNLENLGERALPYRISAHSQQHSRGGYFLVDFYAPPTAVESIMEYLSRDIDVIRPNVVKHPLTQEVKECGGIVPVPLEEKLYSMKKRK
uniref:Small ribosomal subunit protein bS6m n=1 Tax=Equus asinus TaxID=9793 RepID=A0A9L0K8J7_EQUAS